VRQHLFFVTGLAEIEAAANQSLRNALEYLGKAGFEIDVWSFMPNQFWNLLDPASVFPRNVRYHRIGRLAAGVIILGRKLRTLLGVRGKAARPAQRLRPSQAVGVDEGYNWFGRLSFIAFLWGFYVPLELIRVGWHSLRRRPDMYYGVSCQGAVVASLLGRIFRRPVVTRFHGVDLTEADLATPARR